MSMIDGMDTTTFDTVVLAAAQHGTVRDTLQQQK